MSVWRHAAFWRRSLWSREQVGVGLSRIVDRLPHPRDFVPSYHRHLQPPPFLPRRLFYSLLNFVRWPPTCLYSTKVGSCYLWYPLQDSTHQELCRIVSLVRYLSFTQTPNIITRHTSCLVMIIDRVLVWTSSLQIFLLASIWKSLVVLLNCLKSW